MSDRAVENGTEAALLALYRRLPRIEREPWVTAVRRLIDGQRFEDCFTEFFIDCGIPLAEARAKARDKAQQMQAKTQSDGRLAPSLDLIG